MKQLIELSTKTIILKRNEYLKYNGSTDTNLYYLENGSMRIFIVSEGEEQIIRLAYNGNLITSLDSFLTDKPSAPIRAVHDLVCIWLQLDHRVK